LSVSDKQFMSLNTETFTKRISNQTWRKPKHVTKENFKRASGIWSITKNISQGTQNFLLQPSHTKGDFSS